MVGFNLASKQSFFNEWELAGGLIAAGIAAALADTELDLRPAPIWRRRSQPALPSEVAGQVDPEHRFPAQVAAPAEKGSGSQIRP
jgi:hypothetical protein